MAIIYTFHSSLYVAAVVRSAGKMQSQMTFAERVLAYTEINPEKGHGISVQPPKYWPEFSGIEFENVLLRYENGPKVLKDVSFRIIGSEKIDFAGRTGAEKSTIVTALMRMAETDGRLIIGR